METTQASNDWQKKKDYSNESDGKGWDTRDTFVSSMQNVKLDVELQTPRARHSFHLA